LEARYADISHIDAIFSGLFAFVALAASLSLSGKGKVYMLATFVIPALYYPAAEATSLPLPALLVRD
jgi:hypothetical protein